MSTEILKELLDVFPTVNYTVPYIEMKFRMAGKHGEEKLLEVLASLVEKGVLSKFDFNNQVHYKSKEDIPLSLDGSAAAASSTAPSSGQSDQLTDLSKIVVELSKTVDNDKIHDLVQRYQDTYM
ncbi:MAG: hypothetical protein ACXAD7_15330 [Candidatus Kariarchaeaceae archaeon]|jgi:hypothetical protein